MVNGKPADDPYVDMVGHGLDLDEPKVAARLREIARIADRDVQELLSDLIRSLFVGRKVALDDYRRQRLFNDLDTVERLCAARPAPRQMRKRKSWIKTKKKKKTKTKTKTKTKKKRAKRARR